MLDVERAALRLRLLHEAPAERLHPIEQPRTSPLVSNREWTEGDQRRLGNLWDRVMANTGAEGILNAEAE
jgi:hypothetical protein